MSRFAGITAIIVVTAACGCSSLSRNFEAINPFKESFVTADAQNPAVELACVWQPGEGRNAQGLPARGFSGQLFFFTQRNAEPVIVDGHVRVYLFADRGSPEESAKPIQQFDFTADAWKTHATMTSLGPGYSVFIPYPGPERYQVRCQLRARFTPKEGPPIWSEAITMTLEGPPHPEQEPLSWSSPEAQNLTKTVNEINVTHRRGTPGDLHEQGRTERLRPRKLRTDTIPLGELQHIAYEVPSRHDVPARRPEQSNRTATVDHRRKRDEQLQHALAGLDADEIEDALTAPRQISRMPGTNSRVHPLSSAANEPSNRVGSGKSSHQRHPLDQIAPLADAVPYRSRGRRPSYPNLSSKRLRSVARVDEVSDSSRDRTDLRPSESESVSRSVSPTRRPPGMSIRRPSSRSPEMPDYGVWQPLAE